MKSILLSAITVMAFAYVTQAEDVSVKLSNVHLCCQGCVKGAAKAVEGVSGVKAVADQDAGTVEITGPDKAALQKGVEALVKAGYFGESSDPAIKVPSETGAKGEMVHTLKVEGVHLCCPKCVKAVNHALADVPGVTTNNAVKNAPSFTVTGDFKDTDVFAALQKIGLTGHVGQ